MNLSVAPVLPLSTAIATLRLRGLHLELVLHLLGLHERRPKVLGHCIALGGHPVGDPHLPSNVHHLQPGIAELGEPDSEQDGS